MTGNRGRKFSVFSGTSQAINHDVVNLLCRHAKGADITA